MITRKLYSSKGVSGYEHEGCWRKDGKFGSIKASGVLSQNFVAGAQNSNLVSSQ